MAMNAGRKSQSHSKREARSSSAAAAANLARRQGSQAYNHNALPKPLAGLDRLGRQSCINKHGAAACRSSQAPVGARLPGAQPDLQYLANKNSAEPRKRTLSVRRGAHKGGEGDKSYQVVGGGVAWQSEGGHMVVYERLVEMPGGGGGGGGGGDGTGKGLLLDQKKKLVKWHVMGSPACNFSSVIIFPFDSRSKTCTLIQEYCPGTNSILSGIPAGSYEPSKHADLLQAAMEELNEEAGLKEGRWIALAPNGIPADKYSRNRVHPYLAIDCLRDDDPLPQDDTESITVEHGVPIREALARLSRGDMPGPAVMTTMLAIEKLREMGLVTD